MGKKKDKEPEEPEMPVDEDGNPFDDLAIAKLEDTIVEEMVEELVTIVGLEVREKRRQEITAPYSAALLVNDCLRVGQWYAMARDEGSPGAGRPLHEAWALEVRRGLRGGVGGFGQAGPLSNKLTLRCCCFFAQDEPATGKPDAWARGAVPTKAKKKDAFAELEHMKAGMARCVLVVRREGSP